MFRTQQYVASAVLALIGVLIIVLGMGLLMSTPTAPPIGVSNKRLWACMILGAGGYFCLWAYNVAKDDRKGQQPADISEPLAVQMRLGRPVKVARAIWHGVAATGAIVFALGIIILGNGAWHFLPAFVCIAGIVLTSLGAIGLRVVQ